MLAGLLTPGTATVYGGIVGYNECQSEGCSNPNEYILKGAQYGAEESFKPATNLLAGGLLSYSIGSFAVNNINSQEYNKNFNDLSSYRKSLNLPSAGSKNDNFTIARLDVNGKSFYAKNGLEIDPSFKVNAISKGHAEIQALEKAYRSGVNLEGSSARMYVDRDLCTACGQNAGVASFVDSLKLKELTIYSPTQTVVIGKK